MSLGQLVTFCLKKQHISPLCHTLCLFNTLKKYKKAPEVQSPQVLAEGIK